MFRAALVLTLLALLAPSPAALAQSSPFGPLPPAAPTPTPAPEPADDDSGTGDVGRVTLFAIGAGVLLAFFGIGFAITRDARRHLTEDDRAAVEGTRHPDSVRARHSKQKQRARARAKAQRAARRKGRR